jgi:predicted cation transporter
MSDDPPRDPVLVKRAQAARLAEAGQRLGYGLFGAAVVVFVVGFAVGFTSGVVTAIVAALVLGSAVLAPAIVVGYGVKAADRHDRGLPDGH